MTRMLLLALLLGSPAAAQPADQPAAAPSRPRDPASRIAAQRESMKALAFLEGTWRGEAEAQGAGRFVHTERVGSLLDGSVRVVEGRGYDGDGKTVFNALGIISYDPVKRSYSMHSYAMGYAGDFPLTVRADGFGWTQPAGPGASIRYTATVKDGIWHEVGERVAEGQAPVKTFEMRLSRIGATGWPQDGAIPPR